MIKSRIHGTRALFAFLILISVSPAIFATSTLGPEVNIVSSCLANNGRVDVNLVNTQTSPSIYTVIMSGRSAQARVIEPENRARIRVTGRPPGSYSFEVLRDGLSVLSDTVQIDCSADIPPVSTPEVTLVNSCVAGNGLVQFQMVNPSNTSRVYIIEFDNVPNRSTTAAAFGQALRGTSGRPDGFYGYKVRTGSTVIQEGSVEVDCDDDMEAGDVIISEFVASNDEGLADNTGKNPDWIELYNTSAVPVNLSGWTLTAGSDTHIFSNIEIDSGEYLVIFASGDPDRSIEGELHVDFKLSADGESLTLADDSGISSIPNWSSTYPAQLTDISYGVDAEGEEFFFNTPTPGSANFGGITGFLEPVTFSLNHGFYNSAQSVVLSTTTPPATILYTTDGSTPSATNGFSVPSGTAITVSQTTVLRAVATRSGAQSSSLETRSYLFAAQIANRSESTPAGWPADNTINEMRTFYGMDDSLTTAGRVAAEVALTAIPTISITTDLENLFDPTTGIWTNSQSRGQDWERPASIELIDPTGTEPGFEINGGLRIKGNGSRNLKNFKHSMRLVFNNEYSDGGLNYPIHGSDGVDTFESLDLKTAQSWSWNRSSAPLAGRGTDADWLRDVWNRDTQGAMGQLHTRSKYVHTFLNGEYWGLYYTEERTSNQFASQYLGGKEGDYDVIKQDFTQGTRTVEARDGTVDAWISMWSMVEDHALNDAEWARFQNEIDIINLADFYLLMWVAGDSDSTPRFTKDLSNNWLAVRDRTGTGVGGKWHFVDVDSESALCTNVQPERMPDWNPTPPWNLEASLGLGIPDEYHLTPAWLFEAALTRPEFVQVFRNRVQLHLLTPGGALTVDESIARLDNRLPSVNAAIDAEAARWGNTWVEPGFDRINWESASQNVRDCFALRTSVMLDYLDEDGLLP